ncbi:hypothetical protein [Streptomyces erythrochromogenes]|uniref:hypothetical protein n=1 Tax=Streptomyces erythrochromogenes TaxID=285574 RepID=UPI003801D71C
MRPRSFFAACLPAGAACLPVASAAHAVSQPKCSYQGTKASGTVILRCEQGTEVLVKQCRADESAVQRGPDANWAPLVPRDSEVEASPFSAEADPAA